MPARPDDEAARASSLACGPPRTPIARLASPRIEPGNRPSGGELQRRRDPTPARKETDRNPPRWRQRAAQRDKRAVGTGRASPDRRGRRPGGGIRVDRRGGRERDEHRPEDEAPRPSSQQNPRRDRRTGNRRCDRPASTRSRGVSPGVARGRSGLPEHDLPGPWLDPVVLIRLDCSRSRPRRGKAYRPDGFRSSRPVAGTSGQNQSCLSTTLSSGSPRTNRPTFSASVSRWRRATIGE